MPVYEYECKKCKTIFEAEQRIVDPPLNTCRLCGGSVERLISKCSFVLKGDGWYVTEHPSKDRKEAMEKGEKPKDKTKSKEILGKTKSKETPGTTEGKKSQEKPEIKAKNKMGKTSPATSSPSA